MLLLVALVVPASAQNLVGKWRSIDDNSGKEKSIVEIYERAGKIYGKILQIFPDPGEDPDPVCDECDPKDNRYKKKIIGLEIIRDMVSSGTSWESGTILDPEVGKVYGCKLWIENGNLMVRGYWGPFYRTQVWKKAP